MTKKPHLTALTSLRFLAALFVFFSHIHFLKGTALEFIYIDKGYIGVTFFFILSGFILSYTQEGKTLLKRQFYISRFARIYPLHILTFIASLPFVFFVDWGPIFAIITNSLLIQSYFPIQGIYFSGNAPAWSISAEMFFYLLFPFLLQIHSKHLIIGLTILATVQCAIVTWSPGFAIEQALLYISPFSRLFDFILGIIIFRNLGLWQHINPNIAQTGAFFSLILFMYISNIYPIPDGLLFDLYFVPPFCFMIIAFARNDGVICNFISKKTFILLGEASFAFYLCHQLIIRYLLMIDKYIITISPLVLVIMAFSFSVLTSIMLFKYFEVPMKRWILKKLQPSNNIKPNNTKQRIKQIIFNT